MADGKAVEVDATNQIDSDAVVLAELGYKQELKRGLSVLTNFGVSFCILSHPTGVIGSFATAWFWGGPVTAVWGWLLVSLMVCGLVGPAMAEICSAYPTAGGLYYWAAKLGGKHGRFASWITGWFNMLGQIAITSSVAMAACFALIIEGVMATCPSKLNRYAGVSQTTVPLYRLGPQGSYTSPINNRPEPCPFSVGSDGIHRPVLNKWAYINSTDGYAYYNGADGVNEAGTMALDSFGIAHTHLAYNDVECVKLPFNPTQPQIFGIFVALMVLYAILNSVNIKVMDLMLKGSIFLHIFGSLTIIIGLPIAARVHQKGGLIFGRFQPGNWGASYGHGVTKTQPYSSIYSGYLFNDNINNGGNGISVTTDAFATQVGASRYGMVTDSSTTTTGTVFNYDGSYTSNNNFTGPTIFPVDCKGKTPGHGNTGCIVRSTYHQNFLGLSNKNQGTPKSAAMPYIFFCGMLMAQWSYTGYDSCVHMVEETTNAQVSGPAGIMRSLTINAVFGLALIFSIIGSIQDYRNTYFGPLALNWNPVAQIMWDVFEERTGNGRNACGFWGILMTIFSACGMSCLTSNARMCYAFSRDGAVPGHQLWHTIDKKTGVPLLGIWFMAFCAIAIAVPVCYSQTAYAAVTSITTIGLYISYATPMLFRVINRADFKPGPFFLGEKLSLAVHTGACMWVGCILVIFVLPNTYPINMTLNFNYAIIAVGFVLTYALGTWYIPGPKPLNARKWFTGPHLEALHFDVVPDGGPGASVRGGEEALKAVKMPEGVKMGVI